MAPMKWVLDEEDHLLAASSWHESWVSYAIPWQGETSSQVEDDCLYFPGLCVHPVNHGTARCRLKQQTRNKRSNTLRHMAVTGGVLQRNRKFSGSRKSRPRTVR